MLKVLLTPPLRIVNISPQNFAFRIGQSVNPQHSVFCGGAMLADIMKDKEGFWMTKQEYEEKGIYVLEKLGVKVGGKVRQKYPLWTNCQLKICIYRLSSYMGLQNEAYINADAAGIYTQVRGGGGTSMRKARGHSTQKS